MFGLTLEQYQSFEAHAIAAYEADNGPGSGGIIPWATIIPMLLSMLTGCIKPPAVATPAQIKETAAANPRYIKYGVIEAVGWRGRHKYNIDAIVTALGKGIASAPDPLMATALAVASPND